MTGISLMDLRMKMESNINPRTMISIKSVTPMTLDDHAMLAYIFCVIPETMEAKIKSDVQFDMPFSVINSPIRISKTDPTVIVNAVAIRFNGAVLMTCPPSR